MCKLYEILLIYKKHYLVNVLNWKRECYLLIHERYSKPVARELQKHYIDLDPVTKRKPQFFWLEYNGNDQTLFTCNICIDLLFCSIYKRARRILLETFFWLRKVDYYFKHICGRKTEKKPLSYTNLWMKTLQRYYFSNAFWKINLWRNIYKMKLTIFMKILTC